MQFLWPGFSTRTFFYRNLLHIPESPVQASLLCEGLPENPQLSPASHASLSHTLAAWRVFKRSAGKGLAPPSAAPGPPPEAASPSRPLPFVFGDGNLGVKIPVLVAFFGEESPPGEEKLGSVVCPQRVVTGAELGPTCSVLSPHPTGSQSSIVGPTSSLAPLPTPDPLNETEAPAMCQRASALGQSPSPASTHPQPH
nr:histone-lysine N-methyltransferase 2D-like [Macaca nemestrina]